VISERHRHRYEFNNAIVPDEDAGMRFSGTWSLDAKLVEIVEIPSTPLVRRLPVPSRVHVDSPLWSPAVRASSRRPGAAKFRTCGAKQRRRSGNRMRLCDFEVGLEQPLFPDRRPCVIEGEDSALDTAGRLEITEPLGIPFIYKSSFDKANRSSHDRFAGAGPEQG
jgi:hypothetical protein